MFSVHPATSHSSTTHVPPQSPMTSTPPQGASNFFSPTYSMSVSADGRPRNDEAWRLPVEGEGPDSGSPDSTTDALKEEPFELSAVGPTDSDRPYSSSGPAALAQRLASSDDNASSQPLGGGTEFPHPPGAQPSVLPPIAEALTTASSPVARPTSSSRPSTAPGGLAPSYSYGDNIFAHTVDGAGYLQQPPAPHQHFGQGTVAEARPSTSGAASGGADEGESHPPSSAHSSFAAQGGFEGAHAAHAAAAAHAQQQQPMHAAYPQHMFNQLAHPGLLQQHSAYLHPLHHPHQAVYPAPHPSAYGHRFSLSGPTPTPLYPPPATRPATSDGLPHAFHTHPHTDPARVYAFVSLPGQAVKKRPRRRYDEIERLYTCGYEGCTKSYGTLNHLNAHVTMQKHGPKRLPGEFKEMRKAWRAKKREEAMAAQSKHAQEAAAGSSSSSRSPPNSAPPTQATFAPGAASAAAAALALPPMPPSRATYYPAQTAFAAGRNSLPTLNLPMPTTVGYPPAPGQAQMGWDGFGGGQ